MTTLLALYQDDVSDTVNMRVMLVPDIGDAQVVDFIQESIESKLTGANASRNFLTQSLMPGATPVENDDDAASKSVKKLAAPQKQVCTLAYITLFPLDTHICVSF
jgi:hypothetical protein